MAIPSGGTNAVAVTPHDTNPVVPQGVGNNPVPIAAIYVGGAGNVAVRTVGGDDVVFTAPPVGTTLYVRATHVLATGTTATLLIATW